MKPDPKYYQGRPYIFAIAMAGMLFFLAVGLTLLSLTLWMLVEAVRMQSWQATTATIQDIEQTLGTVGRFGPTARTRVVYRYSFAGKEYLGTRIGIFDGSDNLGPYQQETYRRLFESKEQQQPVQCFVNPSAPSQAVLFRRLRWELLAFLSAFAVAFTWVGSVQTRWIWRSRPSWLRRQNRGRAGA